MLTVTATEYIMDFFPGAVRFHFVDAYGIRQELLEKIPVLGLDYPEDASALPFKFKLNYTILERLEDEVLKVELPHGISDDEGNSIFFVRAR